MSHKVVPQLIEMYHRYQCSVCKTWVTYSEANGKWWHLSDHWTTSPYS